MASSSCRLCHLPTISISRAQNSPVDKSVFWSCALCGPLSLHISDALTHCLLTEHDWPFKGEKTMDETESMITSGARFSSEVELKEPGSQSVETVSGYSAFKGRISFPSVATNKNTMVVNRPLTDTVDFDSFTKNDQLANSMPTTMLSTDISEIDGNKTQQKMSTENVPSTSDITAIDKNTIATETTALATDMLEKLNYVYDLTCQKCKKTVKLSRSKKTVNAIRHVSSCCRLRPYRCTKCRGVFARKFTIKEHIDNICPAGTAVLVDKEQNETAIRNGLRDCFPGQVFNWKGYRSGASFSSEVDFTEPVSQSVETVAGYSACKSRTSFPSMATSKTISNHTMYVNGQLTDAVNFDSCITNDQQANRTQTTMLSTDILEIKANKTEQNALKENIPSTAKSEANYNPITVTSEITVTDKNSSLPKTTVPAPDILDKLTFASDLTCQKCKKTVKLSHSRTNAIDHVTSCCRIRPYRCTKCQGAFARKFTVKEHIAMVCPTGTAVLVDKEENEIAIRNGLRDCFPGHAVTWRGFRN